MPSLRKRCQLQTQVCDVFGPFSSQWKMHSVINSYTYVWLWHGWSHVIIPWIRSFSKYLHWLVWYGFIISFGRVWHKEFHILRYMGKSWMSFNLLIVPVNFMSHNIYDLFTTIMGSRIMPNVRNIPIIALIGLIKIAMRGMQTATWNVYITCGPKSIYLSPTAVTGSSLF